VNIALLSHRVMQFFSALDQKRCDFNESTTIACPLGCGKCCEYPRIQGSILEFLPLAKHLWDQDKAFIFYRSIHADTTMCVMLKTPEESQVDGRCSEYAHRGLICRSFGFLTTVHKNGKTQFQTCTEIKNRYAHEIQKLAPEILQELPMASLIRRNFESIYPTLAVEQFPINLAIKRAIELVYESGYRPVNQRPLPKAA